jgi:hypothetical protein
MVVRILTARVGPRHAARFSDLMRAKLAELKLQPGLVYAKLARRIEDDEHARIVLIEEWRTVDDLRRWTGGSLEAFRLPPGAHALVEQLEVIHHEALDLDPTEIRNDEGLDGDRGTVGPSGTMASVAGPPSDPATAKGEPMDWSEVRTGGRSDPRGGRADGDEQRREGSKG